ncbi:ABC transporter permease [Negativibacillus massiliensis]|uniref:ABC transporter permease n=1 Tax=Negativibacillus massiliensis TaxID=1871035 RepID=UPI003AF6EC01
MNGIVQLQLWQFSLIYLLLLIVIFIMKRCSINRTKLLIVASIKMTVQLILSGLILTYIFENPHPIFVVAYVSVMVWFSIHRVLSNNKDLNKRFKTVIALSIASSGLFVLLFFVCVVVGESIFNPQYVIPISGMLMGNTMTGVSLGIKTFRESLDGQRAKINALLCFGAAPKKILMPFVKQSLETAMLPTINSMIGMGVVSLPGMMTGQILSGTLPTTAILYQIAIMIAICTMVTSASFGALYFGYRTLYDSKKQII